MTGDEPKHLNAVVDKVRFASRDNPITEIKLRTGRGGSLKNSLADIEEQEEDTGLPVIIGGTNASGKTSLLRGIQEVCNLLQLSTISKKRLTKVSTSHSRHGYTLSGIGIHCRIRMFQI